MTEQIKYIPARLKSAVKGGHVIGAEDIDAGGGKSQQQVNNEIDNTLALYQSEISGLNSQNYVTVSTYASLPATGEADTIYRVSSYDGTQVDATKYAEYAWNGSAYVLLDVKSAIGEVFDISEYKAVGGTLAKFTDLSAALNSGNNVPVGVRKGGMSVKFVRSSAQNSDNNYVQARCIADEFTTDVTKWQGVDAEPVAGSKNLVESDGIAATIGNLLNYTSESADFVNVAYFLKTGRTYYIRNLADSSSVKLSLRARNSEGVTQRDVVSNMPGNTSQEYTAEVDTPLLGIKINSGNSFVIVEKDSAFYSIVKNAEGIDDLRKELTLAVANLELAISNIAGDRFDYISETDSAYITPHPLSSGKTYLVVNTSREGQSLKLTTTNESDVSIEDIVINLSPYSFVEHTMVSNGAKLKILLSEGGTFFIVDKDSLDYQMSLESAKNLNDINILQKENTATNKLFKSIGVDFAATMVKNYGIYGMVEGETANINPTPYSNFSYTIIEVSEGEVWKFTVRGGTAYRAYGLLNINKTVLDVAESTTAQTYTVTIPNGCKYLVINNDTNIVPIPEIVLVGKNPITGRMTNAEKRISDIESYKLCLVLNQSLAMSDSAIFGGNNDAIVFDIITGQDIVTRQRLYGGSVTGDASYVEVKDGNLVLNIDFSSAESFTCKPNTKYRIILSRAQNSVCVIDNLNYARKRTLSRVGSNTDNGTMIGCSRTTFNLPFMGKIVDVFVVPNYVDNMDLSDIKAVSSHYYNASSFTGSTWKDIVGNTDLTVSGGTINVESISYEEAIKEVCLNRPLYCGCVKEFSTQPEYCLVFNGIEEVLSHFKMACVKNGFVQYFLKQDDITKKEDGTSSVLDGTDGDVLLVPDVPLYYINTHVDGEDIKLWSLNRFTYKGIEAEEFSCKGIAPSLCFVDKTNEVSCFARNANNVSDFSIMFGLAGKYIPTESGGTISYTYDGSEVYAPSGAYRPTDSLDQNKAERSAMNKSGVHSYTNFDLVSKEIMLSMAMAECRNAMLNSPDYFGYGYMATNEVLSEAMFTNGTKAVSCARFKDSNNDWIYQSIGEQPFTGITNPNPVGVSKNLFAMLTNWKSPWEIMEQHLVLSYAKSNSIAENTWFVYNSSEYKYRSVPNCDGIDDGVMTAVVWKKFKSKLSSEVVYDGVNIGGNDIEYVFTSAVYRGYILDVPNHIWLTGINCVLDGNAPSHYYFFIEKDYKKYIMNKEYSPIASNEKFDFESVYELVSDFYTQRWKVFLDLYNRKSIMLPEDSIHYNNTTRNTVFEIETDGLKANTEQSTTALPNCKIVTGVKNGYGPLDVYPSGTLYLWHPRTYNVALAGYSSFVCQDVQLK